MSDRIDELAEELENKIKELTPAATENVLLQNQLLRKQIEIRELGIKWFKMLVEAMMEFGAKKQGIPKEIVSIIREKMNKDGLL